MKREIKARVFAQYLGQRITNSPTESGTLQSSDLRGWFTDCDGFDYVENEVIQLILRPLSSLTDEDAIEVAKMANCKYCQRDISDMKPHLLHAMSYRQVWSGNVVLQICQYLQSKGYDLPNYLLGGKTLREAGLAIYPQE